MSENTINKIIYFDKETIKNILQEINKGEISKKTNLSIKTEKNSSIEALGKVELSTPLWVRLKFLFSSKLNVKYISTKDDTTSISSTELSEFEKLKPNLIKFENVQVFDIENSASFFRVAGGYLRIVKGGVDNVDIKEFKNVMDSYNGYDTYKIDDNKYIRFNNAAFLSNYKRNDIITAKMSLYCIHVGKFDKERFDFIKEVSKMEHLITNANNTKTLADVLQIKTDNISKNNDVVYNYNDKPNEELKNNSNCVDLYDVLYACIEYNKPKKEE